MGRKPISDEQRKQNKKEYNAKYFHENEVIRERNLEKSKQYYHNNKGRINKRIALYNKEMRAEFKRLKAVISEQLEMEKVILEELNADD